MRHDKTAELTRHKRIISPFKHHPASSSPLLFFSNCLPLKQLHQSTPIVYLRYHDDHCFGRNPTEKYLENNLYSKGRVDSGGHNSFFQ